MGEVVADGGRLVMGDAAVASLIESAEASANTGGEQPNIPVGGELDDPGTVAREVGLGVLPA